MRTKTASIRLGKEDFENIDTTCEKLGCTRNDFVKDAIRQKLNDIDSKSSLQSESDGIGQVRPKPKGYRVLIDTNRNNKQTNVPEFELDIPSDNTLLRINGRYFRNCKNDNEVWDEVRKDVPTARLLGFFDNKK